MKLFVYALSKDDVARKKLIILDSATECMI